MPTLSQTYDDHYVTKIVKKTHRKRLINKAMKIVYNYFQPNSVIDFGCANGLHLKALKQLGCESIYGIEGTSHFVPHLVQNIDGCWSIKDITKPLNFVEGVKYDLAMCIEVLEHIKEKHADLALANIAAYTDTILFTAATSKGGYKKTHVNVQPKRYWKKKFIALGFRFDFKATQFLRQQFISQECHAWFQKNLLILRRNEEM